ncbi:MAG: PAS domain S-box protein [Deltaproteobacteria bacterium]|jgi:two-component system cell cycle sensor histidine kinase/response regulator CckA|nr:PAS domain S-box protein [Deltaproteobacteria bacterium]
MYRFVIIAPEIEMTRDIQVFIQEKQLDFCFCSCDDLEQELRELNNLFLVISEKCIIAPGTEQILKKIKQNNQLNSHIVFLYRDKLSVPGIVTEFSDIIIKFKDDSFVEKQILQQMQCFHDYISNLKEKSSNREENKHENTFLKENPLLFRAVYNSAYDAIFLMQKGRFIDCNPKTLQLFELDDRQMIIDKSPYEFSPEFQPDGVKSQEKTFYYLRKAEQGYPQSFYWIHKTAKGRNFHTQVTLTPVNLGSQQIIMAVVRDITELIKEKEKLKAQEKEYRLVFDNSGAATVILEEDGTISLANKTFERLSGYSKSEVENKMTWMEMISPEYLPVMEKRHKARRSGHKDIPSRYEFDLVCKDRTLSNILLEVKLIPGTMQSVASLIDITKLKNTQKELAASRENLRITLESIGDGVIATDAAGKIININNEALKILELERKIALHKPFEKIFSVYDVLKGKKIASPYEQVMDSRDIVRMSSHTVTYTSSGRKIYLSSNGAPILDKNNQIKGVVVVFRDVTEKIILQKEVQKTEQLKSIGILAGGIAHDFNNILTAIVGTINLLQLECEGLSEPSSLLKQAESSADRAKQLANQLLTFSKGGTPIKEVTSVQEIISQSTDFILHGSGVELETHFDIQDSHIFVDKDQIYQVFSNLAINAMQAMPQGGKLIIKAKPVQIGQDHPTLESGKYLKIDYMDNGPGISQEAGEKIFSPYYTTKERGHGLGLAIVHSIIDKHRGSITFASQLGKGTVFTVHLPVTSRKPQSEFSRKDFGKLKGEKSLLLLDDEALIRKLSGKIFNYFGFKVSLARNSQEVLEIFGEKLKQNEKFDLVILDLTLPGSESSVKINKNLKEMDSEVKTIISSGYSNSSLMADYRKYGFDGILRKPYKMDDITEMLSGMFGGES